MFLQRLLEYAERLNDLPPSLHEQMPVKWVIDIDHDGKVNGIVRQSETDDPKDRGRLQTVPYLGGLRTSGIMPLLFADNASYVLGQAGKDKKQERIQECYRAFKDLVQQCAQAVPLPEVQAVHRFYEQSLATLNLPDDFQPEDSVTFRVNGRLLTEIPEVQRFWRDYAVHQYKLAQVGMYCLICGQQKPALRRHFVKIKRVPGGQESGVSLSSANASAFYSYNLKEGMVSPMCLDCSEKASKTLNRLLADKQSGIRVGPLAYVFWTRKESDIAVAPLLENADPVQVRKLMEAVYHPVTVEIEDTDFYAASLSANAARAVVRSFLETTLSKVKTNLARWFRLQQLVRLDGSEGEPLGIYRLAASLYRDANKEMVSNVPETLITVALSGAALPDWMLFSAIKRNRAEQGINYPRAILIKTILASQEAAGEEDKLKMLDPNNRQSAYCCGRLLAVLESIQRRAIPNAKSTLVDRFYGSASSAPASVFGTLVRGAQDHLSKLRKNDEPAFRALSRHLEEVMDALESEFPATLNLREQAVFALGFYHQKAADRAAAIAYREKQSQKEED